MKMFIAAVSLIILITAGVIINTVYIDNLTSEMLSLINELPENTAADIDLKTIETLDELWNSNKKIVAITAKSDYIISISAYLVDTKKFITSDNNAEYQSSRLHLRDSVVRLRELERFTIDNII